MFHQVVKLRGLARHGALYTSLSVRSASTVSQSLLEAVERLPMKEVLRDVDQDLRLTVKNVKDYAEGFANGLLDSGVRPGDVILTVLGNTAENIVTQLAAARAGFHIAALSPEDISIESVAAALKESKATVLVFDPELKAADQFGEEIIELIPTLAPSLLQARPHSSSIFPNLREVITTGPRLEGILKYKEYFLMNDNIKFLEQITVAPSTPFVTTYSGGKKGSTTTQGEAVKKASALAKSLSGDDRVLLETTEQGVALTALAALEKNATVVLASGTSLNKERLSELEKLTLVSTNSTLKKL